MKFSYGCLFVYFVFGGVEILFRRIGGENGDKNIRFFSREGVLREYRVIVGREYYCFREVVEIVYNDFMSLFLCY